LKRPINLALPKGVRIEENRHGKTTYYYRSGQGEKRIRLPDNPKSDEFQIELRNAIAGNRRPTNSAKRFEKSQFGWLINEYMSSRAWNMLATSTKRSRSLILQKLSVAVGKENIKDITQLNIQKSLDRRFETPSAANSLLKVLRALFIWAVEYGYTNANPAMLVKPFKCSEDGFHTWTEEELERFENFWAIGTRERLAYEIMLKTGLRRSDAVRLSRSHIREGILRINPYKTPNTPVTQKLSPELLAILQGSMEDGRALGLTYVRTESGNPMKPESFTNWFRKACRSADVCGSAHGLRKAAAVRAAHAGLNERALQSFFGWTSGKQAQLYTKRADRELVGLSASETMNVIGTKKAAP
jgi:integrase